MASDFRIRNGSPLDLFGALDLYTFVRTDRGRTTCAIAHRVFRETFGTTQPRWRAFRSCGIDASCVIGLWRGILRPSMAANWMAQSEKRIAENSVLPLAVK